MSKTIKAWLIVFLGLIIWITISYSGFAFLKAETNPLAWSEGARLGVLFHIFCYGCCSPFLFMLIKKELKKGEQ